MTTTTNTNEPASTSAEQSLSVWMEMWNTGGGIARRICTDDFRIFLGRASVQDPDPYDEMRGGEEFAQLLDQYRLARPGNVFTEVASAIDGRHGRMLWNVDSDDIHLGGLDVFDFDDDGRIRRVWSVTGQRHVIV
jgi:hypothetical protein